MTTPIVKINNLSKIFHSPKEETLAVKDFSLEEGLENLLY